MKRSVPPSPLLRRHQRARRPLPCSSLPPQRRRPSPTRSPPIWPVPLQMDVEGDRVVVAQNFTGKLSEINADGSKTLLATQEKGEVAGVAINGDSVAFLATKFGKKPASFLKVVDGDGRRLRDREPLQVRVREQPGRRHHYGFRDLSTKCKSKVPRFYTYKGIVDSHPYGLADAPGRAAGTSPMLRQRHPLRHAGRGRRRRRGPAAAAARRDAEAGRGRRPPRVRRRPRVRASRPCPPTSRSTTTASSS